MADKNYTTSFFQIELSCSTLKWLNKLIGVEVSHCNFETKYQLFFFSFKNIKKKQEQKAVSSGKNKSINII